MLTAAGVGLGLTFFLLCIGTCAGLGSAWTEIGLLTLAGLTFLGGLGAIVMVYLHYANVRQELDRAHHEGREWHHRAQLEWQQRKTVFDHGERERVANLLEWGAARTAEGTRRIDVIGGTLWGWEAFLTVFGASMMGTRGPLTVLDLSGESVCTELTRLSAAAGAGVDLQRLPTDLVDSDLLVGLETRQFVDALVESMHGDSPGGDRAGRIMDDRLLSSICEALGTDLSMARLAAALRTVMGEPGLQPGLSDAERVRLTDELFSDEYRRQAHGHLRRIESYIHPLSGLGNRRQSRPEAFLTCLTIDSDARNARSDLLVDLIVQWTTRRMLTAEPPRTLVVVGADDLQRRHVERLSDICERRDVRLVFLFRHLRDASLQVLGGGAVAFMRLGNHEEATRAADFIGREHRFVLTELTRTLGGNETHGESDTEGYAETDSGSLGTVVSSFTNWSRGAGRLAGMARGGGRGSSSSRTPTWSSTRNWSTTRNWSEGNNWSDAASQQRVYEYAVEPTTLQHLPDHAMLLVQSRPGGPLLQAVECDPAIITLPRATHETLPELPAAPTVPVSTVLSPATPYPSPAPPCPTPGGLPPAR